MKDSKSTVEMIEEIKARMNLFQIWLYGIAEGCIDDELDKKIVQEENDRMSNDIYRLLVELQEKFKVSDTAVAS